MVSLWPWKGDDSSPAAFERILSTLSTRIGKASSALESTRQRNRRWKALWTLYASFAYLLYLMIAGLVVGWQNWGPVEYTAVSSAPIVIYAVRFVLGSYYDYRISKQLTYLQALQKQRDDTISKLKEATKYNTTQQLLEKYGGTPQKPTNKPRKDKELDARESKQMQKRRDTTGFAPPPTANIPGRRVVSDSHHPVLASGQQISAQDARSRHPHDTTPEDSHTSSGAEFAPNAFAEPRVYATSNEGARWYDRLMDIVLGEDEANPKNRLALICRECRLVNGQAPPGVRNLEEVGKWRCSACGTMNGEDLEAKMIVRDLTGHNDSLPTSPTQPEVASTDIPLVPADDASDHTVYSDDEDAVKDDETAKAKRRKARPDGQKG